MDPRRVALILALLALPAVGVVAEPATAAATRCTVVGTAGDDVLVGTRHADVLCGFGGDDVLRGRGGNDVLRGGAGNDTLRPGRGRNDVRGQRGVDTVSYDDLRTGSVRVDLTTGSVTRAVTDDVSTTENAVGTARDDHLVGGDGPNRLVGGGGDDVLVGGGGDDRLLGSAGDDDIRPATGVDVADGQGGTDRLDYSDLDLDCVCFVKADLAEGLAIEQYNQGVQVIDTAGGFEDLVGSDSSDELKGTDGPNHIDGGTGRDTIWPRLGEDVIDGGGWHVGPSDPPAGGDTVDYSDRGGSGVAVDLVAGTGPDGSTITTIANVTGTEQDDTIIGSPLYAGYLLGRGGDDRIHGRQPCGVLSGGDGDDVLVPDLAPATCVDWDDHGAFDWPAPQEVSGGAGDDRVDLGGATAAVALVPAEDPEFGDDWSVWAWMIGSIEQTVISVETVHGTPWADVIRGGGGEAEVTLYGGGGDDEMDTSDGFGGDTMIQDGSGPGTTCTGDDADTVDC